MGNVGTLEPLICYFNRQQRDMSVDRLPAEESLACNLPNSYSSAHMGMSKSSYVLEHNALENFSILHIKITSKKSRGKSYECFTSCLSHLLY